MILICSERLHSQTGASLAFSVVRENLVVNAFSVTSTAKFQCLSVADIYVCESFCKAFYDVVDQF